MADVYAGIVVLVEQTNLALVVNALVLEIPRIAQIASSTAKVIDAVTMVNFQIFVVEAVVIISYIAVLEILKIEVSAETSSSERISSEVIKIVKTTDVES